MDLHLLLSTLSDPIRCWDRATGSTTWTPALRSLGFDPAQLPTLDDWLERVVPEDQPRVAAALRAMGTGAGAVWSGEYGVRRDDGTVACVVDRVSVDDDPARGAVGVLHDVSAQRAAERALAAVEETLGHVQTLERRLADRSAEVLARERSAKEEAEASSRGRAAFVAVLSHELRTPMNAVIALSSVLADTELDAEQRELAETIRSSGNHLLTLVEEVLDLSKIEAGRLELERLPFAVRATMEEALDMVAARASERGLDLGYAMAPGTVAGMVGDAARLRQVLLNVLGNAAKFTACGSVRLEVRSSTRGDGSTELEMTVRDTGPGIAADRLHALFQPFIQESAATALRYGGTGLGLAISKRLIEAMGGTIGIESAPDAGTVVRFTMVGPAVAWDERAVPEGRVPSLAGKRIGLSIESAGDRAEVRALLERWGAIAVPRPPAGAKGPRVEPPLDALVRDEGGAASTTTPTVVLRGLLRRSSSPPGARALTRPLKPAQLLRALLSSVGAPGDEPTAAHVATAAPRGAPVVAPLDVLVAEDDRVNQRVAATLLRRAGHRAAFADDGEHALRILAERAFDVVLVDLEMPRMGGLELARRILGPERLGPEMGADSRRRPLVIALTADATPEARRACASAGIADFLSKPITPQRLADALARAARASGARPPSSFSFFDLCGELGREAAEEIRRMFLEDAPAALTRLRLALEVGDTGLAARTAHALKASCALFAATALVAELDAAEAAGRRGDLETARQAADGAAPRLAELIEELSADAALDAERRRA